MCRSEVFGPQSGTVQNALFRVDGGRAVRDGFPDTKQELVAIEIQAGSGAELKLHAVERAIVLVCRPTVNAFFRLLDVRFAEAGLEAVEGLANAS